MFGKKMLSLVLAVLMVTLAFGNVGAAVAATDEISRLIVNKTDLMLEEGETYSLTATAVYISGKTEDVTIKTDWTSESPTKATVYAGTVTAKAEGSSVITATFMGKTVIVTATISKKVKALTDYADSFDLRKGQEKQIELTALYQDGTTEKVAQKADWSVDNFSVATVVNGLVTGKKAGTATVTAKFGSQSVTIPVSVEVVRRLDPSQTEVSMLLKDTETIKLMATYPDGSVENVADKTEWESNNEKVADVIKGVITAYGSGEATITAKYGTKTVEIQVTVDATRRLEVNKNKVFLKINTSEQLQLNATYIDGKTEDITEIANWSSSNPSVAFVADGKIDAYSTGEAVITAKYGDKSVEIQVDVEVPRLLDLDKDVLELKANSTGSLKLFATFADGSREDITAKAEWSSDLESVAFVKLGEVTSRQSGVAHITAKFGGKEAVATVEVNVPKKITLSKESVALQTGDSASITATAVYPDGHTEEITGLADWTSADSKVAEVRKGTVTGMATGATSITVTYGTRTLTIPVSIGLVEKLTLEQKKLVLEEGSEYTLKLTATYVDGMIKENANDLATWESSKPDIAEVNKGKITVNGSGTAVITATFGDKKATVVVEAAVSKSLKADITSVILQANETKQIALFTTDSLGAKKDVTSLAEWAVSSDKIAEVSDGLIKAIANGKTTVTAKYGGKTVSISVEVGTIQKLEANVQFLSMKSGGTYAVKLEETLPDGRVNDVSAEAEWKSGSVKVVGVDKGILTANGYGKTRITAKHAGKSITIDVEVDNLKYLDTYTNDGVITQVTLKKGEKVQVNAIAVYSDNIETDVSKDGIWSSSKSTVAHVKHGLITAQGKGKATITIKYANKTTRIQVIVE